MSNRLLLLLLTASLAIACDPSPMDSDAAVPRDARVEEGGLLDGGPSLSDAGVPGADASSGDAGASLCAWAVCDPRSADGCEGGSCALRGTAASCEDEAGALGRDTACTDLADCAPGLACFLVEGAGQCGRICCPDDGAACGDGAICGGSGMLVDGTTTPWGRCLARRSCDVHAPAEVCEDREGCYIVDGVGTTECRVAGTAAAGEPCAVQEECLAGFFCGGVGVTKRCVRICRIGADDCATGESCVAQVHTPVGSGLCSPDAAGFRG